MPSQKIETYFKRKVTSSPTAKLFKARVIDIDAAELARQLTLHDSYLYNLIKPVECMNGAWHHEEEWMAVNIKAMLSSFERVKYWIARTIICEREPSKRSFLISYFINIATECINLRNFNTCMAILEGLRIPPIPILRASWQLVSQKSKHMFEELKVIMTPAGNFPYYRRKLASLNGDPCVPYLKLILDDFEDPQTNLDFQMMTEVERHQSTYPLSGSPDIQGFIRMSLEQYGDEKEFQAIVQNFSQEYEYTSNQITRNYH